MKASYPKRLLVHSSTLPAISSAPHGLAPLRGGSLAGYEPTGEVWPISLSLVLQRFWSKRSPHGYRQLTFGARVPARPARLADPCALLPLYQLAARLCGAIGGDTLRNYRLFQLRERAVIARRCSESAA